MVEHTSHSDQMSIDQGQWSSSTTILGAMQCHEIAAGVVVCYESYESFKDNC